MFLLYVCLLLCLLYPGRTFSLGVLTFRMSCLSVLPVQMCLGCILPFSVTSLHLRPVYAFVLTGCLSCLEVSYVSESSLPMFSARLKTSFLYVRLVYRLILPACISCLTVCHACLLVPPACVSSYLIVPPACVSSRLRVHQHTSSVCLYFLPVCMSRFPLSSSCRRALPVCVFCLPLCPARPFSLPVCSARVCAVILPLCSVCMCVRLSCVSHLLPCLVFLPVCSLCPRVLPACMFFQLAC
jgi:hypothetical protein